jgi:hypothetical protein
MLNNVIAFMQHSLLHDEMPTKADIFMAKFHFFFIFLFFPSYFHNLFSLEKV